MESGLRLKDLARWPLALLLGCFETWQGTLLLVLIWLWSLVAVLAATFSVLNFFVVLVVIYLIGAGFIYLGHKWRTFIMIFLGMVITGAWWAVFLRLVWWFIFRA